MAQNPQSPQQVQVPRIADPDSVPETLCDGQFNLVIFGQLATLTFTHVRPDATQMFADGTMNITAIVRARIVLTAQNLIALREFLNTQVQPLDASQSPAPATGGATRH
jgi:hypothetical protein